MIARTLIAAAGLALLAAAPTGVMAAERCKDAKGRFMKCPEAKPTPTRCRLNGRFVKCGTPGAQPA